MPVSREVRGMVRGVRLSRECFWAVLAEAPNFLSSVGTALSSNMDGQHPFEDVDLNAESRAKRLFVSIEPLPERRIYRIDDRGMETYEEYVCSSIAIIG